MSAKTVSSREFNQDVAGAKRAASDGPVFITDRGRPAHVLLPIEAYHQLAGSQTTIGALLAHPGVEDIDFEPPRIAGLARPADLS